jgi:predicted DNA binding CopG/RHH family protein
MSKSSLYTEAPAEIARELAHSVPVTDFLPSPDKIAAMIRKEETIPVTMNLKQKTVERYKRFAKKRKVRYQTFVSALLDRYAQRL